MFQTVSKSSRKHILYFLMLSDTYTENQENHQILKKPLVIRLASTLDLGRLHPLFFGNIERSELGDVYIFLRVLDQEISIQKKLKVIRAKLEKLDHIP